MILDNFKPLISFYPTGTFKNVLGNTVNKTDFLGAQGGDSSSYGQAINGHYRTGSNLQYNYNTTTGSNTYIDEQTSYKWTGIVRSNVTYNLQNYPEYWANGFTLFVGSGTTAPTTQDYKLQTPLTLDVVSASCIPQENEKVSVIRTFQNNTGADVTVNEVGCYLFKHYNDITPVVMIGRKVLDSGIVIPAGDIYTFTYIIDMSNITLG